MKYYIKKPVMIEAFKVTEDYKTEEMLPWFFNAIADGKVEIIDGEFAVIIHQHKGNDKGGYAKVGDYIVKGIKGEIYACNADIFEATYTKPCDGFLRLNGQSVELDDVTQFVDNNGLSHIEIILQSAPVSEVGVNGLQIDNVIELIRDIIVSFNNNFSCRENAMVITKLDEAILWLHKRKLDREKRQVEGYSQS